MGQAAKSSRQDLAACPMWRLAAEILIRASANHRKVMKAEHGTQIPRKLTANLELSVLPDSVLQKWKQKLLANFLLRQCFRTRLLSDPIFAAQLNLNKLRMIFPMQATRHPRDTFSDTCGDREPDFPLPASRIHRSLFLLRLQRGGSSCSTASLPDHGNKAKFPRLTQFVRFNYFYFGFTQICNSNIYSSPFTSRFNLGVLWQLPSDVNLYIAYNFIFVVSIV